MQGHFYRIFCTGEFEQTDGQRDLCTYQRQNDLAIRVGLELDVRGKARAKRKMVVDFAIHAEGEFAVLAHEWLSTGICTRIR